MLTPPVITRVHVTPLTKQLYSLNILTMPDNASWTLTRSAVDLQSFSQQMSRMAKGEGLVLLPLKSSGWGGKLSTAKIQGYFDGLFGGNYPRWLVTSELVWEFFMADNVKPVAFQPETCLIRVKVHVDTIKVPSSSIEQLKMAIMHKLGHQVKQLTYLDGEGDVIQVTEEDELEAAISMMQSRLVIQAE